MMAEMTAPYWLFWLLGGFVAAGFVAVCWVVAGWCERLGDWLRDRVTPLLEECEHEYTPNEDGTHEWCQKCDSIRPTLLELPPERTWEQMTSHQLPVERHPYGIVRGPDGQTYLGAERERRPPWWEVQHRAAYESLGLDYPSGLMARVRELTP